MLKQALTTAAVFCQLTFAHAVSSGYNPGNAQPPTYPNSAIEVTFDSFDGSGIDYDAVSAIKAILEEGPETVISEMEWRKESNSPQLQLCVTFARPAFMQAFKSQFEKALEGRDERTTLKEKSYCN